MANDGRGAEGLYNINVAGNIAYPTVQNMNMTVIQGQGQDQDPGRALYGYNQPWYPGAASNNMLYLQPDYAYPNLNMDMNLNMIQGQGQHQDQGRAPDGYNQVWYPGAASNALYMHPNPSPATDINMNLNAIGNNGGYYNFNGMGTPYGFYDGHTYNSYVFYPLPGFYQLQPPQQELQQQPQTQAVPRREFDAGRRGRGGRHSSGRNTAGGRGRGRGRVSIRKNTNNNDNNNNASLQGNIEEQLMRLRISEGERSTQVQGEGEGHAEPHEHAANADAPAVVADLNREYSNGRFFVIKSNCRENIVSSIKHGVWTSTFRGNRILNAAYGEASTTGNASCPVFLFFSVKGSGNFCGVAEMDGPVDFDASAECWDRNWMGKFSVKWHIVKDVPDSQFQHITFNTVGNLNPNPIIYCRDTQQVEFLKGLEMLDIFKKYVGTTSLLDDVSTSTTSQKQQSPPPPPRQQRQEQAKEEEKQKEKLEEESSKKKVSKLYSTVVASSDINADQKQQETIEDSRNQMKLQKIANHFRTQQAHVGTNHSPGNSEGTNRVPEIWNKFLMEEALAAKQSRNISGVKQSDNQQSKEKQPHVDINHAPLNSVGTNKSQPAITSVDATCETEETQKTTHVDNLIP